MRFERGRGDVRAPSSHQPQAGPKPLRSKEELCYLVRTGSLKGYHPILVSRFWFQAAEKQTGSPGSNKTAPLPAQAIKEQIGLELFALPSMCETNSCLVTGAAPRGFTTPTRPERAD